MKKLKGIYILFLIFPLINLATGIMASNNITFTIGMASRIALLLFLGFYVFFLSKSKYKKLSIIYYLILGLFTVVYILLKPNFLNLQFLYTEFNYLFKFYYFPILFFGLLNLFDEYGYDNEKWNKIFIINLIIYLVFMLIPIITGTSYNSYFYEKEGLTGWFYAANEIGPIMLMLLPSLFTLISKHQKVFLTLAIGAIFSIIALSTKVSMYGLGIILISYFIIRLFSKPKKGNSKILLLIIIIYMAFMTPISGKLYDRLESYNNGVEYVEKHKEKDKNNKDLNAMLDDVLSNRTLDLKRVAKEYGNTNLKNKFFGLGFYVKNSENLIEMDFLDILFHYGIIGFIIILFPYFYLAKILLTKIKTKEFKISSPLIYNLLIIAFISCLSFLAGHILGSPAVSTVFVIYFMYLLNYYHFFKNKS